MTVRGFLRAAAAVAIRLALLAAYLAVVLLAADRIVRRHSQPPNGSPALLQRLTGAPRLVWANVRDGANLAYKTTRVLDAGHRLRTGDLIAPPDLAPDLALRLPPKSSFAGKYLKTRLLKGGDVRIDDASDAPTAPPGGQPRLRLWLGEERKAMAAVLDVGWTVDLCDDNHCAVTAAKVASIECRDSGDNACAAVLDVTPEQEKAYRAANKTKLVIVVSESASGG